MTKAEISKLHKEQQSLLIKCLVSGCESLASLEPEDTSEFSNLLHAILLFYEKITNHELLDATMFAREQTALYQQIDTSDIELPLRLFAELLLGLARMDLAIQISNHFLLHHCEIETPELTTPFERSGIGFFRRIRDRCKQGILIIDTIVMHRHYGENPEQLWSDCCEFYQGNPSMQHIAKQLASMQYIPPQHPNIMALAQSLHWNGLGGSGKLFVEVQEHFKQSQPDIALTFQALQEHALGFHQHGDTTGFSERLFPFKVEINKQKLMTARLAAGAILVQFPEEKTIVVMDFSSGPQFSAVKPIFKLLPDTFFELHVSDVDAESLAALKQYPKDKASNFEIASVTYLDLNTPITVSDTTESPNLISCGLNLHQLSSDCIRAVMQSFTGILQPGGFIVNSDVGEQGYFQVVFAPGNLADREGFVNSIETIKFTPLCVGLDSIHVKLPYPLKETCQTFPNNDSAELITNGMYNTDLYQIVILPQDMLDILQQNWDDGEYLKCDQLIETFNPGFSQKQNNIKIYATDDTMLVPSSCR